MKNDSMKNGNMKNRHIKVRESHRDYIHKRQPTPRRYWGNARTVQLILKGTWLEKAGFTLDTPVTVIVEENRLVLIPRE